MEVGGLNAPVTKDIKKSYNHRTCMTDPLDNIDTENLDSIASIKVSMDSNSQIRRKFEALKQDLKDASNNRKYGNKSTVEYAINKAYEALKAEENLYTQISKEKVRHIP